MKKLVTADSVAEIRDFPYDWRHWNYDSVLLHSILYAPDDPDICDDEHTLVMDYDGIVEWFLSWKDSDEILCDMNPSEFVAYHLGRTITPVRPVGMTPVVFINCRKEPFVDEIMEYLKQYETRNRNTLGRFLGQRILIAETGHGHPLVRCSAVIDEVVEVFTREDWESYLEQTWVPVGSSYDWQPDTKKKVLYHLSEVTPVNPFRVYNGIRHGRIWMEYVGIEHITEGE